MTRQAIRNEGNDAEREFLRLVRDSCKSKDQRRGDATVYVDGETWYVEIKSNEKGGKINQVRAVKFIPLVVLSLVRGTKPWAVMPPQDVVRSVFEKQRGQHTELALECANLSAKLIPDRYWHPPDQLDGAVRAAVVSARRYPELERCLAELKRRLRAVVEESQIAVRTALSEGDVRL